MIRWSRPLRQSVHSAVRAEMLEALRDGPGFFWAPVLLSPFHRLMVNRISTIWLSRSSPWCPSPNGCRALTQHLSQSVGKF